MNADNNTLLRRTTESAAPPAGDMRDDGICEHVDAQRGGGDDDDARGHGDSAEVADGPRSVGSGVEILQGGGAGRDIRGGGGRDEHADGDRCEPDIGGDVEELFP